MLIFVSNEWNLIYAVIAQRAMFSRVMLWSFRNKYPITVDTMNRMQLSHLFLRVLKLLLYTFKCL